MHYNIREELAHPDCLKDGVLSPTWYLPKLFSKIQLSVSSAFCAHFGHDPAARCVCWKLHHLE